MTGDSYDSLAAEAYEDAVQIRMLELRSAFNDSVEGMAGLAFEDHEPGECVQCDAYRRLAQDG
jgi:hypothetical protein